MRDRTTEQRPALPDRAGAARPAAAPPLPALLRAGDGATLARTAIALQRTHGNAAVASMLAREPVAYGRPPRPQDGLADSGAVGRLAEAGERLGREWDALATPEARAGVLERAGNDELAAIGVPGFKLELGWVQLEAEFQFRTWTMVLRRSALAEPLSAGALTGLVQTFAHETRHPEQWFRVARLLAGQGMKADAIAREMRIEPEYARAAHRRPLDPASPEAAEAAQWYESVYGAGAAERKRVLDLLPAAATGVDLAKDQYEQARKALIAIRADPEATPEQKEAARQLAREKLRAANAAIIEYNALKAAHDALPEEIDAEELGDAVAGEMARRRDSP